MYLLDRTVLIIGSSGTQDWELPWALGFGGETKNYKRYLIPSQEVSLQVAFEDL